VNECSRWVEDEEAAVVVTRSSGTGARGRQKAGGGSPPVSRKKAGQPKADAARPRPGEREATGSPRGGGPVSPVPGTRSANADRQRQAIEHLAEEIFARRGYRGATIREVAAKAGCSVGQIYKLYPNKLELYRAVIDSKATLLGSLVQQTLDADVSPEERLRRMVNLLLGFFQEHVTIFRIIELETGPLLVRGDRRFLRRLNLWREQVLDRTTEVFRQGQRDGAFRAELDAQLATISFFGLLKGHTGEWILNTEGMLVDRADAILDLFFAGVRRGRRR
jgi:TetR/AcrR family transcriptional regulator, fatty acid metabolism regulator protein